MAGEEIKKIYAKTAEEILEAADSRIELTEEELGTAGGGLSTSERSAAATEYYQNAKKLQSSTLSEGEKARLLKEQTRLKRIILKG